MKSFCRVRLYFGEFASPFLSDHLAAVSEIIGTLHRIASGLIPRKFKSNSMLSRKKKYGEPLGMTHAWTDDVNQPLNPDVAYPAGHRRQRKKFCQDLEEASC